MGSCDPPPTISATLTSPRRKLPVERLISNHIKLSDINEAMDALAFGNPLRQVIDRAAEHLWPRRSREKPVRVKQLDHLVLTVTDIGRALLFYRDVLGMEASTFGEGRHALRFGDSKINLHLAGSEFEPKADRPTPGSADLCLLTDGSIADVVAELGRHGVAIEEGPVERTGARGPIVSVYVRDPDANLIELSQYLSHQ